MLILAIGICIAVPSNRVMLTILSADLLQSLGYREQALRVYDSVRCDVPTNNALTLKSALLAYDLHKTEQAKSLFQILHPSTEHHLVSAKHLAIIALEQRDYDKALEMSSEWIKLAPQSALAYESRGSAYASLNRSQEAIRDLNRAIEIDPNSNAVEVKSRLSAKWGAAFPEAFFDPKLENKRNDYDATIRDCIRLMHAMDKDDALKLLAHAIELDSKRPDAYFLRALFYYRDDQYKETIEELKLAHVGLEGRPPVALPKPPELGVSKIDLLGWTTHIDDSDVLFRIGRCYGFLKDARTAVTYYDKSIAVNPKNSSAYVGRAVMNKHLGNLKQAQADFVSAQSLILKERKAKREKRNKGGPNKEDLVEILGADKDGLPTLADK